MWSASILARAHARRHCQCITPCNGPAAGFPGAKEKRARRSSPPLMPKASEAASIPPSELILRPSRFQTTAKTFRNRIFSFNKQNRLPGIRQFAQLDLARREFGYGNHLLDCAILHSQLHSIRFRTRASRERGIHPQGSIRHASCVVGLCTDPPLLRRQSSR